jgi:transcription antitermination factor NusB
MRARSKAREVALHVLYQVEIVKLDVPTLFVSYLESNPQPQEVIDFSKKLVEGALANQKPIEEFLVKYVKNWNISRMAIIDRNILRIACFEMLYLDDVPPKVAINEAIELAKRFGDMDSPRFVNGILDKIYKLECKEKNGNQTPDAVQNS